MTGDWRHEALCRDDETHAIAGAHDPRHLISELGDYDEPVDEWRARVALAVEVCAGCPVTLACAAFGRDTHGTGVYAGQYLHDGLPVAMNRSNCGSRPDMPDRIPGTSCVGCHRPLTYSRWVRKAGSCGDDCAKRAAMRAARARRKKAA